MGTGVIAAALMINMISRPSTAPPAAAVLPSQSVGVLVAAKEVPAGAAITADDLMWQPWPIELTNGQFILQSNNPSAKASYTGALARSSLVRGEPISAQKIARMEESGLLATMLPAGMRAITINVTAESGVGGFVQPHDHVDVIMTASAKVAGEDTYDSRSIVSNAQVIAVDGKFNSEAGSLSARTTTLAVTPDQAEAITTARRIGSLSLLLRSAEDRQVGQTAMECEARIGKRESVSVFRSGTMTQQVFIRPSCLQ
jgi:pilus assembly protein CpaB